MRKISPEGVTMLLKKQVRSDLDLKTADFHAPPLAAWSIFKIFNSFDEGMKKCRFLCTHFSLK